MDDTPATKVYLYIYDLSGGLAASLSPSLLGKKIDGIWHTSIVVQGTEYYFGGGVSVARAGSTAFGQPHQILELGETHIPLDMIPDLVAELRERFHDQSYDLLSNNCNNFTDEMSKLLLGTGIPNHIVSLPKEVMSTPFGQMIKPMLTGMQARLGSVSENPPAPAPPVVKSQVEEEVDNKAKEEFEKTLKSEFQSLIAQGDLTPNQAAALALERVRDLYRARESTGEKSQATSSKVEDLQVQCACFKTSSIEFKSLKFSLKIPDFYTTNPYICNDNPIQKSVIFIPQKSENSKNSTKFNFAELVASLSP